MDGPWLSFLHGLEAWGRRFPGFEKEVEGVEVVDGAFHVSCLTP